MPREKNKETRDEADKNGAIDREVLDVIREEKRKASGRGPRDAEAERKKKKLADDGLKAIKAKDARVFTELLRQAGISEGSPSRVEERLEGFLLGLTPAFRAILWISLTLLSCSSSENCCNDAYMISATFLAAFFCRASLLSALIWNAPYLAARLRLRTLLIIHPVQKLAQNQSILPLYGSLPTALQKQRVSPPLTFQSPLLFWEVANTARYLPRRAARIL
jgi:hypothetical protein